jgi:hypothetical protein
MKRLGIGSTVTVYRLLKEAGIPLRNTPPAKLVD